MHVTQTVVVLELANARVGYFNGKVINTTTTTTLKINPPTPEAAALISRGNIPASLLPLSCIAGQLNSQYTRMTIASILEQMSILSQTVETTIRAIIMLQDHTGSLWGTAFDEVGTNLLGISAKELYMLQYDFPANRTPQSIIKNVLLSTFIFTLFVTIETYNSQMRLKTTITKATPIDFQGECALLLVDIARMSAAIDFHTD
ncbi:hypothetical protein SUGI_0127410 [Cryptomeria japonica]|nr:hypothetical protein SUGI_0127410 [Cryptomeria japonica]